MCPEFDVSDQHKLAYLLMRKCGCSSIRRAISTVRNEIVPLDQIKTGRVNEAQCKLHEGKKSFCYHASNLPSPQKWFKFTVVRDPISRFLSFYSSKILNQNLAQNHTFKNYDRFGLLPNMSIEQVIDVLRDDAFETEPHAVPQSQYLTSVGYELDYIGRLEQLQNSLDVVFARSNCRLQPERLNQAKQLHVMPTTDQFNQLVDYYRNDIDAFGYPSDFRTWHQTFVEGRESRFQIEPGFTFEGEAKLLKHRIWQAQDGFRIDLQWRPDQTPTSRQRAIRIGMQKGNDFDVLMHLPLKAITREEAINGMVNESILAPFHHFPENVDLKDVYHQLYFTDGSSRAMLLDYADHDNMLLFPFGHLRVGKAVVRRAA